MTENTTKSVAHVRHYGYRHNLDVFAVESNGKVFHEHGELFESIDSLQNTIEVFDIAGGIDKIVYVDYPELANDSKWGEL